MCKATDRTTEEEVPGGLDEPCDGLDALGEGVEIEAGLGVGVVPASNITDRMRPWRRSEPIELPRLVLVLRSRADANGNELISALEEHLREILTPARS